MSSQALKLDAKKGIKDLLYIFLAILSWNMVIDAGLPLWCNDSEMILLGDKGPQTVQVKEVLHDSHALRSRCARVFLVGEVDKFDKRNESNHTIPAPESVCAPPPHSAHMHSMTGLYLSSSYFRYMLTMIHIQPRTRI
jgi:hypothetical protein